ncbi:MAG TPA: TetR/AcrR family transcriptional regulator C-terminal domain-containing protein [Candidatus Dormibacteraeota bacterium]|nr:TetR/AcrR family transcriptional regulator C-terminal domain-containing protein [Candidatus Dormibacteraeota bacterium]
MDRTDTITEPDTSPSSGDGLPQPPWVVQRSRRRRPVDRKPLDRGRIVDAALRIVDADGVTGLSVRRLADELGVSPMSLYWHVRDKDEVLELVGQAVLGAIEVPAARGDWRDQVRDIHRAMYRGFIAHPNTGDLLIGRARYSAAGIGLFERILATLLDAGFSPEAAFAAYQSLYWFTLGAMATASRSPEFIQTQLEGLRYLASLPPERFPAIRAITPEIGQRSLEQQFEIGLDIQIEGIAARLAPK